MSPGNTNKSKSQPSRPMSKIGAQQQQPSQPSQTMSRTGYRAQQQPMLLSPSLQHQLPPKPPRPAHWEPERKRQDEVKVAKKEKRGNSNRNRAQSPQTEDFQSSGSGADAESKSAAEAAVVFDTESPSQEHVEEDWEDQNTVATPAVQIGQRQSPRKKAIGKEGRRKTIAKPFVAAGELYLQRNEKKRNEKIRKLRKEINRKNELRFLGTPAVSPSTNLSQIKLNRLLKKTSDSDKAFVYPKTWLFLAGWDDIGKGAINQEQRERPDRGGMIREFLDRKPEIVVRARELDPENFGTYDQVAQFYHKMLDMYCYSAAHTRLAEFDRDLPYIYKTIGEKHRRDVDRNMPQFDLPFLVNKILLNYQVDIMGEAFCEFAKATYSDTLAEAGYSDAEALEFCRNIVDGFLSGEAGDVKCAIPVSAWKGISIRNLTYHADIIASKSMKICAEASTEVVRDFRKLSGAVGQSPGERILITIGQIMKDYQLKRATDIPLSYERLRLSFSEIPREDIKKRELVVLQIQEEREAEKEKDGKVIADYISCLKAGKPVGDFSFSWKATDTSPVVDTPLNTPALSNSTLNSPSPNTLPDTPTVETPLSTPALSNSTLNSPLPSTLPPNNPVLSKRGQDELDGDRAYDEDNRESKRARIVGPVPGTNNELKENERGREEFEEFSHMQRARGREDHLRLENKVEDIVAMNGTKLDRALADAGYESSGDEEA